MSDQRELAAREADDVTRALRLQVAALEKEAERLRALCSSEMAKNFEYEAEKAAPGRLLAKATRLEAEVARLRLYEAPRSRGIPTRTSSGRWTSCRDGSASGGCSCLGGD